MIKILDINNVTPIRRFNKYQTAILQYNNIPIDDVMKYIPDTKYSYLFEEYYNMMEILDGTNEYINFILQNKNKKFIAITDHDNDGIFACVNLVLPLAMLGIDISYMPTDRFNGGYGMKKENIDKAIECGAEVIITADQGITTLDAIKYAHEKGLLVCCTDHHNGNEFNEADVVVDPCYYLNKTQFKEISGATVVLKLNYCLYKYLNMDTAVFDDLGFLAGVTVLSDCMPLIGENRILYKAMITRANELKDINSVIHRISELLGFYDVERDEDGNVITEFIEIKNFNKTNLDFYFIPVINAVNRVEGNVTDLVTALIDAFYGEVNCASDYFININNRRKEMKMELLSEWEKSYDSSVIVDAIKIDSIDNYSGIAGLVASDLVEEEHKPALIGIDQGQEILHFSGRSLPGYNLYNLLAKVQKNHPELNLQFGGHDEALGAAIPRENLQDLRDYLDEEFVNEGFEYEEVFYRLDDPYAWMNLFRNLYPFGNKFEMPRFYIKGNVRWGNKETQTFGLVDVHGRFKTFSKSDLRYLTYLKFNRPDEEVELAVELCYDEDGSEIFKLINILNKKESILEEMDEKYREYLQSLETRSEEQPSEED